MIRINKLKLLPLVLRPCWVMSQLLSILKTPGTKIGLGKSWPIRLFLTERSSLSPMILLIDNSVLVLSKSLQHMIPMITHVDKNKTCHSSIFLLTMVLSTKMVANIRVWKGSNAEELLKKIWKTLTYWKIKKTTKWDWVYAQDLKTSLSLSLGLSGMLTVQKSQREWLKLSKPSKLKSFLQKNKKPGIDG